MKQFVTIMIIAVYGLLNLLGHAGVHFVLGNSCCQHAHSGHESHDQYCNSAKQDVCSCQSHKREHHHECHSQSDELLKGISHRCKSHSFDETSPRNSEHENSDSSNCDEEECQYGQYFSQLQIEVSFTCVVLELYNIENEALVTVRFLDSQLCLLQDVRGPPCYTLSI